MNTYRNSSLIALIITALVCAIPCAGMEQSKVAEQDLVRVTITNRRAQPLEVFMQQDNAKVAQFKHMYTIMPDESREVLLKLRQESPFIPSLYLAYDKDAPRVLAKVVFEALTKPKKEMETMSIEVISSLTKAQLAGLFEIDQENGLLVRPGVILFQVPVAANLIDEVGKYTSYRGKNCGRHRCDTSKGVWKMDIVLKDSIFDSFGGLCIGDQNNPLI